MNTTNHISPSGEDAANGAMPDTGNAEADQIINRLSSSDPEFDDCIDAVAFIRKLVAEHKGPEGFATWKDAALDERHRRLAAEKRLRDTSKELICAVSEQSDQQDAANGAMGERAECPQCGARGQKDEWLCPRSTNSHARCARAASTQSMATQPAQTQVALTDEQRCALEWAIRQASSAPVMGILRALESLAAQPVSGGTHADQA